MAIAALPVTIDKPGCYVVARDLVWTGTGAAIRIACSNVTLDLGGHRLAASAYTEFLGKPHVPLWSVGVQVGDLSSGALSNVTVCNGTLEGFNASLFSAGVVAGFTTGLALKDLVIQHVASTISLGATFGVLLLKSSMEMDSVSIRHITGSAAIVAGVTLAYTSGVGITRCTFEDISNAAGVAAGIAAMASDHTVIRDATVSRLMTGLTHNSHAPGHTCIGMVFTGCTGVNIGDSRLTDISGGMDDAHGISLFGVSTAEVRDVEVERVSDGRGGRGAKATGIEVYGNRESSDNAIEIVNCQVRDIFAFNPGDLQAAGFSAAGAGISFTDCKATNVRVAGFNESAPDSQPGFGIGFGWAPDFRSEWIYPAKQVKFERCVALSCDVGFATFNFQDSTWIDRVADDTRIPLLEQPGADSPTPATRTFFVNQGSEATNAPRGGFIFVTVTNSASGNTV